jgi:hypothetical protein
MKKKFSIVFIGIMLIMLFTSCSNNKDRNNNSKVLATVDNIKITQHQVDTRKKDSEFIQQEKFFSDKEVLDKIIEQQLLLIKAKELNITMSDNEVKENYKGMLQQMSFKKYIEGDEKKIDKNTLEALRNTFVIQKTMDKLGSGIDQALKQLKEKVKIKYYV